MSDQAPGRSLVYTDADPTVRLSNFKISKDQKTITFKIKKGLEWSDGIPLTSADVYFTWKLITNPNTRTPYGSDYTLVSQARTPDEHTFIVTYDDNYAPALDTWASLEILPKHILENEDINSTYLSLIHI